MNPLDNKYKIVTKAINDDRRYRFKRVKSQSKLYLGLKSYPQSVVCIHSSTSLSLVDKSNQDNIQCKTAEITG